MWRWCRGRHEQRAGSEPELSHDGRCSDGDRAGGRGSQGAQCARDDRGRRSRRQRAGNFCDDRCGSHIYDQQRHRRSRRARGRQHSALGRGGGRESGDRRVPVLRGKRVLDANCEPDRAVTFQSARIQSAGRPAVWRAVFVVGVLGRRATRQRRPTRAQAVAARSLGGSGRLALVQERDRRRWHRRDLRRLVLGRPQYHRHRHRFRRIDRGRGQFRFCGADRHPRRSHHGRRQDPALCRLGGDREQSCHGATIGEPSAWDVGQPARCRCPFRHSGIRLRARPRIGVHGQERIHARRCGGRSALRVALRYRRPCPHGGVGDSRQRPGYCQSRTRADSSSDGLGGAGYDRGRRHQR